MAGVAAFTVSSGIRCARDRRMVMRGLRGRGLLQRIADATGNVAASALKTALLHEAPQLP